ncbi:MAG: selenoneine biosynthesis selenosugar synthase SenB [Streptosporangiaceae bacterium]
MRILIVTPAPPRSYYGNRITARRWATLLGDLGHTVEVTESYDDRPVDLLVALHARKSAEAVRRVRALHPEATVVLALTGTDLYPDLTSAGVDPTVLGAADRLVVLQRLAVDQLPEKLSDRVRVIHQSVESVPEAPTPNEDVFDAVLLAHLRPVKDPLVAADAAWLLYGDSRVRVRHAGAAIDPDLARRAAVESRVNPRYTWFGELSRPEALRLLAGGRLLVHPSRHEGGANVISEALAAGIPVVATRIPGTEGILGADYPGYFPPGDAMALADLLFRVEHNVGELYDELLRRCADLRPLVAPERERAAWEQLLAEVSETPLAR